LGQFQSIRFPVSPSFHGGQVKYKKLFQYANGFRQGSKQNSVNIVISCAMRRKLIFEGWLDLGNLKIIRRSWQLSGKVHR